MNALSCFFAAFLLFSGQAHGISGTSFLSLSSETSQALSTHGDTLEQLSERFAQAGVPTTQEDFVEERSIKLSCAEYLHDKKPLESTPSLTLSEIGTIHTTSAIRPKYLVFRNQGLMGAWENNTKFFKAVWRIEDNGKWISEWMGKVKESASEASQVRWENATPSVIDPDYKVISYTICKQITTKD